MANFFKNVVSGLLYVIFCPLILVFIALSSICGLLIYVFMFFKCIFLFFTGRNLKDDLPEDIEAKRRLEVMKNQKDKENNIVVNVYTNNPENPGSSNVNATFNTYTNEIKTNIEKETTIENKLTPISFEEEIKDFKPENNEINENKEGGENDK